jgi:hypothetical protein
MWQIRKELFIENEGQADEVNKEAPESYWTLFQLAYWVTIVCGLIAAAVIVETVLMSIIIITF